MWERPEWRKNRKDLIRKARGVEKGQAGRESFPARATPCVSLAGFPCYRSTGWSLFTAPGLGGILLALPWRLARWEHNALCREMPRGPVWEDSGWRGGEPVLLRVPAPGHGRSHKGDL